MKSSPIPLYSFVALLVDLPHYGLRQGDIATLVDYLEGDKMLPDGFVCEAANGAGETIAVFTLRADQVVALTENDVLHVRSIGAA